VAQVGVLDAGVHPVDGVEVGVLPGPAVGIRGPVGDPQGVPPAVAGQLGDVRFLDPSGPVRAGGARAGVIGAALADLPAGRR
jgi:hypothetical protein